MRHGLNGVVRIALLVALASCGMPSHRLQPVPLPELEPASGPASGQTGPGRQDLTRLWTVLGRASIRVEMRGIEERIRTSKCDHEATEGCATCDLAGPEDLGPGALDALVTALGRYPTSFLDASGVQRIALCRSIRYDFHKKDDPAGMADLTAHRLLVSIDGDSEDTVHHEVFHMLDWEINARNYSDDPEWQVLNPHGFTYGTRKESMIQLGFVNTYATTNVYEDRASVFQYVMARPDELCTTAESDPIVAEKVRLLWTRIAATTDVGFLRARATCPAWVDEIRYLRRKRKAVELEPRIRSPRGLLNQRISP